MSRQPERVREKDKYSITELISPPQQAQLKRRHEVDQDAADLVWSLVGSLGHSILEKAALPTDLAETRLSVNMEGCDVSGQLDNFTLFGNALTDYKFTTVWRLKDGISSEWEEQLNSYAYLLRINKYEVNAIQILAIYRDWSIAEAMREKSYPQKQGELFNVPLWSQDRQEHYLKGRLLLHKDAATRPDEGLPVCSDEERWTRPTTFRAMRRGNKKASKVFILEDDAKKYVEGKSDFSIDKREGIAMRCQLYCQVSSKCTQWSKDLKNPKNVIGSWTSN